jgi:uncharacterized membrane protein
MKSSIRTTRGNIHWRFVVSLLSLTALAGAAGMPSMLKTARLNTELATVQAQSADGSEEQSTETFATVDVPGATVTIALDVNAEGVIVGRYATAGQTHGFLLSPAGELMTIDFPGASFTVAASLNDRRDIVGQYALPSAPTQRHGFLLKDGVYSSFDPPGSLFTNALGINERGDIVGRYCTLSRCRPPGNGDYRGFLLRDGEFTNLDVPGAIETDAFKINGSGQILGGFVTASHEEELFVQKKNSLTMMALANGKPVSVDIGGLNERGDIVGSYCDSATPCVLTPFGTHGFLISGDEFQTVDVPGALATTAIGINARSDIVGGYTDTNGRVHGFLLTRPQE